MSLIVFWFTLDFPGDLRNGRIGKKLGKKIIFVALNFICRSRRGVIVPSITPLKAPFDLFRYGPTNMIFMSVARLFLPVSPP